MKILSINAKTVKVSESYKGPQKYWYGISNGWGVNMVKAMPIKLFVVIY